MVSRSDTQSSRVSAFDVSQEPRVALRWTNPRRAGEKPVINSVLIDTSALDDMAEKLDSVRNKPLDGKSNSDVDKVLAQRLRLLDGVASVVAQFDQTRTVKIALPLSDAELAQPNVVPAVAAVFNSHGLRAEQLIVVSSMFAPTYSKTQGALEMFKAAGAGLEGHSFPEGLLDFTPADIAGFDQLSISDREAQAIDRYKDNARRDLAGLNKLLIAGDPKTAAAMMMLDRSINAAGQTPSEPISGIGAPLQLSQQNAVVNAQSRSHLSVVQ